MAQWVSDNWQRVPLPKVTNRAQREGSHTGSQLKKKTLFERHTSCTSYSQRQEAHVSGISQCSTCAKISLSAFINTLESRCNVLGVYTDF